MAVIIETEALDKLFEVFERKTLAYNSIIAAAEKSPFLARELNAFGRDRDWSFVKGRANKGIYSDLSNKTIAARIGAFLQQRRDVSSARMRVQPSIICLSRSRTGFVNRYGINLATQCRDMDFVFAGWRSGLNRF
ncbi:hypothetical protein [Burkholderia sp. 22PA0106]|uniref:hypothetical protein n=1 Tax=Burkholderia sp. 22PA0106 TaxID=3237371 RepID=UPI0039C20281